MTRIKPYITFNSILLGSSIIALSLTALEILWPRKMESEFIPSTALLLEEVSISPSPSSIIAELSAYAPIIESPLFTTDRKAYKATQEPKIATIPVLQTPPVENTEENTEPDNTFSIQGIIRTPKARIALLLSDNSNEAKKVKVSDVIEGWEVISIETNEIILRKGSNEQNLFLVTKEDISE